MQPTETTYVCCAPGCKTPGHDISVTHKHTYSDATRAAKEAEAAAVAKRTVPQTLFHCHRPDCLTDPHGQDITHVHTFTFNEKGN